MFLGSRLRGRSIDLEPRAAAALTARTNHPAQGVGPQTMRTEEEIAAAADQDMRPQ